MQLTTPSGSGLRGNVNSIFSTLLLKIHPVKRMSLIEPIYLRSLEEVYEKPYNAANFDYTWFKYSSLGVVNLEFLMSAVPQVGVRVTWKNFLQLF